MHVIEGEDFKTENKYKDTGREEGEEDKGILRYL